MLIDFVSSALAPATATSFLILTRAEQRAFHSFNDDVENQDL
jgi:hypothetical protein